MTDPLDPRTTFEDPEAPVQPWQQAWEFGKVLEVFAGLKPRRILEIGTYRGGTLYQWLKRAPQGARIVTVDPVSPDPAWQEWGRQFEQELYVVTGQSSTAEVAARVGEILPELDFLFVDGDHHYEAVRRDWEIYGPRVRPGGVVVFHDILDMPQEPWVRVDRLWAEIKAAGHRTEEWYLDLKQGVYGTGVVRV
ncbi:MAG: class I SAM-dependent methyltransferase [Planctomycetes bacterium]|nr:class I SAM-dependent methyltransferase [Planctomycetota bacterium]